MLSYKLPSQARLLYGLLTLFLLLSLTACASNPVTAPVPPAGLLQPCPNPPFAGRTNGDLARYALALRGYLDDCNADKAALSEYFK